MQTPKITFLGHSAVLIEGTKNFIIDPFLTENPSAPKKVDDLPHIDFVLITHDHFDHFGDAIAIAKRDRSTLVAIHEVTQKPEVIDAKISAIGMNIGGTYTQDGVSMSMTQAIHSSAVGSPAGFVLHIDGKNIYHAGDTSYFSDMTIIPKLFGELDVALLPIGGHYTMDIAQAALAVKDLKPKVTIPIHFNTWPPITADVSALANLCAPFAVNVLQPGDSTDQI